MNDDKGIPDIIWDRRDLCRLYYNRDEKDISKFEIRQSVYTSVLAGEVLLQIKVIVIFVCFY